MTKRGPNWSFGHWSLRPAAEGGLALPLLMPRIAAHDIHSTLAPHDFAVLADPFDARSTFPGSLTLRRKTSAQIVLGNTPKATQYIALRLDRTRGVATQVRGAGGGPTEPNLSTPTPARAAIRVALQRSRESTTPMAISTLAASAPGESAHHLPTARGNQQSPGPSAASNSAAAGQIG